MTAAVAMPSPAMPQAPVAMPPQTTHDVVVTRTKKSAQAKVVPVPPEEFGIARSSRNIRDANYCFHKLVTLTQSDLIAQGYDKAQIEALPSYGVPSNDEAQSRDTVDEQRHGAADINQASRIIEVTEHYIRADYDGTGKAGLYKVTTGGHDGEILKKDGKADIEPVDFVPFAAITPVIVTHRFFGRSIADLVMDIQRIKTALQRGMLDNLYLHNNPRVEVAESHAGANTLDDLLVSRPGGIVRTKQPGGVQWQEVPDVTGSIYPALEYFDTLLENRTGVTKRGQGLDADALVNQSATAAQLGHNASQERMKLIARIFAETGIKDLFILLHGIIRTHGQEAQTVRLRNEWVQIDPRDWKARNDLTVHVGIGSGGKQEQAANMTLIGSYQEKMVQAGKTNLVDDEKLFNAASELVRITGHKNPDRFFNDPKATNQDGTPKFPPPPPPVDPKMEQIKVQAQLDEQADQRKAQIESVQAQADITTQNQKTNAEMVQSQQEFEYKKELALLDFQLQRELKLAELEMKREMHQQTIAQNAEQHQQAMQAGVFKVAAGAEAHDQKMEQGKAAAKDKSKK